MYLSKNFTLEEFIKSSTAKRLGIKNIPDSEGLDQLRQLAEVLQKIRDRYKKPIIIDSGYRCPELNKAVGGAVNSDHLYCSAVDIHSLSDSYKDNKELFKIIEGMCMKGEIEYRQLINEGNYNWIHFSINNSYNSEKHQIIK